MHPKSMQDCLISNVLRVFIDFRSSNITLILTSDPSKTTSPPSTH